MTNNDLLVQLNEGFTVENEEEVSDFLTNALFLLPILHEVQQKVKFYFPEANLHLEVDQGAKQKLIATIMTTASHEDASRAFKSFVREWWSHQLPSAQGQLGIDLELQD